jgi:phosphomannomutase
MRHLRQSHVNLKAFLGAVGEISDVDETDGLRVTLLDGKIVHLRPSGNAPEMRCYVEAETEEAARALLAACLNLVRSWASKHQ